uniref:Uncharacterized protein n=1 Tax=Tanacetum cinerariifolium TaxID=118510 RepID=A0A6L2LET5_TANCI|nr:hypothetical protein [Tanacetum cinerariifolium]
MDDPNITMAEYIQLEEEKSRRLGQEYNWETATYYKIWYDEDVHYLRSFEKEFPAIVYNDALTSEPEVLFDFENEYPAIVYNNILRSEPEVSIDFENEFPAIHIHVSIWRILGYGYGISTSCTVLVIEESLVKTKQRGVILELKRRHLKNIIFCYYTPYPAMKIRRINSSSSQERVMINSRYDISLFTYTPYAQLFINQRYAFNVIDVLCGGRLSIRDNSPYLQVAHCIRFNKEGIPIAVSRKENGIITFTNPYGIRLLRTMENSPSCDPSRVAFAYAL